jgi:hypothetical protein
MEEGVFQALVVYFKEVRISIAKVATKFMGILAVILVIIPYFF